VLSENINLIGEPDLLKLLLFLFQTSLKFSKLSQLLFGI